jgi:hypothetical protein
MVKAEITTKTKKGPQVFAERNSETRGVLSDD